MTSTITTPTFPVYILAALEESAQLRGLLWINLPDAHRHAPCACRFDSIRIALQHLPVHG